MLHSSGDLNQKYSHKTSSNIFGGEKVWLKIWFATWMLMRKRQNTKQSTKANTTISALRDAKNLSKQTLKNISRVTHQVKIAVAVITNAKPLKLSLYGFSFCFFIFRYNLILNVAYRRPGRGKQMNEVTYMPIGVVHSPFKEPKNVPIQASASKGAQGSIQLNPKYAEGLKDLEGFSHIILLYHFNLVKACSLLVKPFLDDNLHGVFATRSPARPNAIGISTVRLTRIENSILYILDVDILDGTPLLDIKPYVPKFDNRRTAKIGWFSDKISKLNKIKDDGRFCK
jgi:tRNA-Thr(GGU) m(6)t(6)A37 methyltransferase TsaA